MLGHIEPTDPKAPPIKFEVNLPVEWNGRSLQYGGGGFNGVLITGLGLPPAYPFDKPSPLAQRLRHLRHGFRPRDASPASRRSVFALNDEAFENFAYRFLQEVRDAAVALMARAYGKPPAADVLHGISRRRPRGADHGATLPAGFRRHLSRACRVINWVGLQHAGTRSGACDDGRGLDPPGAGEAWSPTPCWQACDKADGSRDLLVQDPVGCKANFRGGDRCVVPNGQSGDQCLTDAQIAAINTLHSTYKFPFPLRQRPR